MPPFAQLAPLGWFACFAALTAALRLPAPPPHSLCFVRRFRLSAEETGSPKFLGNSCHTCPALRLRWNLPEQASGASPLRLALSVLPSELSDSSASTTAQISEPNHAAYVLAVYASCRSLPSAHARLASGWRPCLGRAGLEPAELLTWFLSCLAYMTHLQDEALLGARRWIGVSPFAARCASPANPSLKRRDEAESANPNLARVRWYDAVFDGSLSDLGDLGNLGDLGGPAGSVQLRATPPSQRQGPRSIPVLRLGGDAIGEGGDAFFD